jgi:hypothetical protein
MHVIGSVGHVMAHLAYLIGSPLTRATTAPNVLQNRAMPIRAKIGLKHSNRAITKWVFGFCELPPLSQNRIHFST